MDNRTPKRQTAPRRAGGRTPVQKITRRMVSRLRLAFVAVLLCFVWLSAVLFGINKNKGDSYEKKMLAQQSYVSNVLPYKRGDILDRNENKLASSEQVYNLIISPADILQKDEYLSPTLKAVSSVFSIDEDEIKKIINEKPDSKYVSEKAYRYYSKNLVDKFKELQKKDKNIQGIWFEEDYRRNYPYSTVACDVIGFSSSNNSASWGIEGYYNDELNGSYGRSYGYYDSELNLVRTVKPAVDGNTIVSTIDVNVQGITEECIAKFQEETGAKNIAVMVMNPQNGEIYAMASDPVFDLNNPYDLHKFYSDEEISAMTDEETQAALDGIWRNYCISDAYEPGSTFKPMTVAAAIDEGIANEQSTFICDGGQQVADRTIRCVNRYGHGELSLSMALEKSCNDVMMQLVGNLGTDTFYQYVRSFNFGRRTGIDLPGEGLGLTFSLDILGPTEMATSSFGQGQSVTMVQLASAFCSVINGGDYYTPHVVKEIRNESGVVVQSFDNLLIRKTITSDTSKLLRQFLYKTVEEGTASPAQVSGYAVGGKTGTAEKYPRGQGNYLVSFIGFTPVEDPQVVVYVIIDEPNVEDQAHSTYATEFSSNLMKKILPLLGVYEDKKLKKDSLTGDDEDDKITLPSTQTTESDEGAPEGGFMDGDSPMAGEYGVPSSSGEDEGAAAGDSASGEDGTQTASPEVTATPQPGDGTTGEPAATASPSPTSSPTPEPTMTPSPTPAMSQHSTTQDIQ